MTVTFPEGAARSGSAAAENGTTSSPWPSRINTGSATRASAARLLNLSGMIKRTSPGAMSTMLVKMPSVTTPVTSCRAAISSATAPPSEWPNRTRRDPGASSVARASHASPSANKPVSKARRDCRHNRDRRRPRHRARQRPAAGPAARRRAGCARYHGNRSSHRRPAGRAARNTRSVPARQRCGWSRSAGGGGAKVIGVSPSASG